MNVDATNLVVGRLSTFAAKKALSGEKVVIVNAERAVITGTKNAVLKKLVTKLNLSPKGNPHKGPKYSKMPDRILRRAVRGMLPCKRAAGKKAFRRVYVYIGIPEELGNEKFETIEIARNKSKNYMYLEDVSRALGARW